MTKERVLFGLWSLASIVAAAFYLATLDDKWFAYFLSALIVSLLYDILIEIKSRSE